MPIDTIKIDRSFVRDLETDPEDRAIIQAIIAMAHSLELQVTAEGVETRGQLEALARMGCDEYQGYLFSRPLPAAEIAARFLAPGDWFGGAPGRRLSRGDGADRTPSSYRSYAVPFPSALNEANSILLC